MADWRWRTLPDETVEVDRRDGRGFSTAGSEVGFGVEKAQARVLAWAPIGDKYAQKYGVPLSWILGVMFAESGGNPSAENPCCVGLMAIHLKAHGKTRAQMLDPEQNIDYGTSLLARSKNKGYDLPAAASIHVAGGGRRLVPHAGTCSSARGKHPSFPAGSPWGMCEHMFTKTMGDGSVGYIDRVVRANNSFAALLAGRQPGAAPPGLAGITFRDGAVMVASALLGYAALDTIAGQRGGKAA